MATARSKLVDLSVTPWYHCITRCVRQAFLMVDGQADRKRWLENRLKELTETFSVAVGGFAILDNHLHILVRIDSDLAMNWSAKEVATRWARLFPPRDGLRRPIAVTREWLDQRIQDANWIAKVRGRLANLGWFMKSLKEPLARMANREDGTKGTFFEGRFRSIAVLDEESLLAITAYIDLNPVAAGIAELPEYSDHTSIKARVEHVAAQDRLADLTAARRGNVPASMKAKGLEDGLWLLPVENRLGIDSPRKGMIEGFTLAGYLLLLDYSSRLLRPGKATVDREAPEILNRLGCDSETWRIRLQKLSQGRLIGRCLAATRDRLNVLARHQGVQKVANLASCPAR